MLIENKPGCVEATAQIFGDKWTPLLVHSLAIGPRRFCELQKATSNINPRTLSARLAWLEKNDIVAKNMRTSTPPCVEYALTSKGTELVPILRSMATWGEKYGSWATSAGNQVYN
jgi:DNA-binding HxlR family transcriptional regulator